MKVILLKDVSRLGRKFEVKDVPDGHAQNFLLPRGLAERATPEAVRKLEKRMENAEKERAEAEAAFAGMLEKIRETGVSIAAEANEQGHLFRAIHADDIVRALGESGFSVRPDQVLVETPLKELGTHEVRLVSGEKEGTAAVTVTKA